MTSQPQNNDLRRKADEKIAQKESKLFKDYVDKDFGFGNYIFISLDDAIDAMLEFHQEQGQREARPKKQYPLGRSACPFCGGTKTTPFIRQGKSQNCTSCDTKGTVSNRWLSEHDLTEFIEPSESLSSLKENK